MPRTARQPLLSLALDDGPEPRHRQLYAQLRAAILAGRLSPGARLPSSRLLAGELGCARGTVILAFEQLAAEGYVRSAGGSGTFVAGALPEDLLAVRRTRPVAEGAAGGAQPRLSRRADALLGLALRPPAAPMGTPFAVGQPALDQFPFDLWARLLEQSWRRLSPALLLGGHPAGHPALREAIAEYLRAARGLDCRPEDVVVTAGTQHAISLVARLVLDPGDPVWLEEPCFPGLRVTLMTAGAAIVPVPVDAEGVAVAAGRTLAPQARLAVVTPARQYPLGIPMTLARRLELLRWAEAAEAWIIEDDYDSEYRYRGRPLEPLRLLDESRRVIYVGTFSKVLFPTLRLGYLVAPPPLAAALGRSIATLEPVTATVAQPALARFIAEGHFAVHLRRMRHLYGARQAALLAAARDILGDRLRLTEDDAGMHVVGESPQELEELDDTALARRAQEAGIALQPLSRHYAGKAARRGLMFGFAAVPPERMAPALTRIARLLEDAEPAESGGARRAAL